MANLLALWRLHGWDEIFRQVWEAGVVLTGVSAGSVCWHAEGTTDSFGPELRPVTNGLGFPPSTATACTTTARRRERRPLLHQLVADATLPRSFATDDGVGLVYRATELVEAVSEVRGKGAYEVARFGDAAHEERIEPRLLAGAT